MTPAEISRLVLAAGRQPLERDTLYNIVNVPETLATSGA